MTAQHCSFALATERALKKGSDSTQLDGESRTRFIFSSLWTGAIGGAVVLGSIISAPILGAIAGAGAITCACPSATLECYVDVYPTVFDAQLLVAAVSFDHVSLVWQTRQRVASAFELAPFPIAVIGYPPYSRSPAPYSLHIV